MRNYNIYFTLFLSILLRGSVVWSSLNWVWIFNVPVEWWRIVLFFSVFLLLITYLLWIRFTFLILLFLNAFIYIFALLFCHTTFLFIYFIFLYLKLAFYSVLLLFIVVSTLWNNISLNLYCILIFRIFKIQITFFLIQSRFYYLFS